MNLTKYCTQLNVIRLCWLNWKRVIIDNDYLLQNNIYFRLGQLASMALLQGGAGFHIFASSVWNYLAGMKVGDIVIAENEVADGQIKIISSQVSACFSPYCSFVGLWTASGEHICQICPTHF